MKNNKYTNEKKLKQYIKSGGRNGAKKDFFTLLRRAVTVPPR